MAVLHRGDVVLVPFPFTDLSGRKVRPAVIVSPDPVREDIILAFITSVIPSPLRDTDYLLDTSHPEFSQTGLKGTSVFRMAKFDSPSLFNLETFRESRSRSSTRFRRVFGKSRWLRIRKLNVSAKICVNLRPNPKKAKGPGSFRVSLLLGTQGSEQKWFTSSYAHPPGGRGFRCPHGRRLP